VQALQLHGFLLPALCAAAALAQLPLLLPSRSRAPSSAAAAAAAFAPPLAFGGLQLVVDAIFGIPGRQQGDSALRLVPRESLLLASVAAGLAQALLLVATGLSAAGRALAGRTAAWAPSRRGEARSGTGARYGRNVCDSPGCTYVPQCLRILGT